MKEEYAGRETPFLVGVAHWLWADSLSLSLSLSTRLVRKANHYVYTQFTN
jgi:hypothetical protein